MPPSEPRADTLPEWSQPADDRLLSFIAPVEAKTGAPKGDAPSDARQDRCPTVGRQADNRHAA